MQILVTGEQMKQLDQATIQTIGDSVPGFDGAGGTCCI